MIVKECNVIASKKISNKLFKDVSKSVWYYDAVKYVYENNIIKGYSNGNFDSNDKLTGYMIVVILHRLESEKVVNSPVKFKDVSSNSWYSNAIKWAVSNKIIYGYNDGTFKPNNSITRQDFIVMLYRYDKYKHNNISNNNINITNYKDYNKISSYAIDAMKWSIKYKIIVGSKGYLNPQNYVTRAEVAVILERYLKK